jgi:hypothetical protein
VIFGTGSAVEDQNETVHSKGTLPWRPARVGNQELFGPACTALNMPHQSVCTPLLLGKPQEGGEIFESRPEEDRMETVVDTLKVSSRISPLTVASISPMCSGRLKMMCVYIGQTHYRIRLFKFF